MKHDFLLLMALLATTGLWAENTITYTAKSKLTEITDYSTSPGIHVNAFNVSITSHTFSDGTGTISFSGDVTEIGQDAFYDCSDMTSINIPTTTTSFGSYAFCGCSGLTSISIPNSVTKIEDRAFLDCTGLTSINIPNSVTKIEDGAFMRCSGLTSMIVETGNKTYDSRDNCNAIIETATNTLLAGCKNTIIPNNVTSINGEAFEGCTGLTFISIPANVASIGDIAFRYCTGLVSVIISDGVKSIGDAAFYGCTGLTSISIPNSVTEIGKNAFYKCTNLTSVAWNAWNCNSYNFGSQVESFVFGDSVQVIPNEICKDMTKLTSVTIPSSVRYIYNSAFQDCTGISALNINIGVSLIGDSAFYGLSNKDLKEIILPSGVGSIGHYAFAGCSNLQTISLGAQLEVIGEHAFQNDEQLMYIKSYSDIPPFLLENAFDNYDMYLQVPCVVVDEYKAEDGWKLFCDEHISCLSAEEKNVTSDQITVTPYFNTADFTWPANDTADSYVLEIKYKDVNDEESLFGTFSFNANGQLNDILFVPGRNERRSVPSAILTANGWQFTVTGLNQAGKYTYTMDVLGAYEQTLMQYKGEFVTKKYVALDNILTEQPINKFIRDGQLYILRDGIIYDARGARVE